jgi:hypothetical protein
VKHLNSPHRRGRLARLPLIVAATGLAGAAVFATPTLASAASAKAPAAPKPAIPSSAQPQGAVPSGFASWAQVYAMQNKLDAAATRILAAGGAGNASIVAAPQSRQLVAYWHGTVSAGVRALAGRLGVPVTFRSAPYTFSALVARAHGLATQAGVTEAAPRADGSGLNVTVTASTSATGRRAIQAATSMPMTITTGQRSQALFSRQADIPPFWGGSRYFSPVGGCTNGFALSVPGAPNVYEISAGHCGENGQPANIPGQAAPTGTILAKVQCRDNLAISYPAGVAGRIYNGPFNSSASTGVAGATPDFVGNLIETGGSSSGEHFNIPVLAVDLFASVGGIPCAAVGPLDAAGLPGNQCVVAPGDSGGPTYSYLSYPANVLARGTVTSGFANANCPGVSPIGSNTVFYAPLLRPAGDPQIGSLQNYGVGILTG